MNAKNLQRLEESKRIRARVSACIDSIPDDRRKENIRQNFAKILAQFILDE